MTESAQQGTHFWFMSFIVPTYGPTGFATYRRSGHFTPQKGATTRFDAFDMLLSTVKQQSPELEKDDVISFDIQPNRLSPGTHFWFMSFIVPGHGLMGFSTCPRSGHFIVEAGATTRFDAFEMLLSTEKQRSPELEKDGVVLSFDIQPDKL
jgi:hypothetical protein